MSNRVILPSWTGRAFVFAAVCTLFCAAARAQGNYEIQVYGADTIPPKQLMVELHSNFTPEGQKNLIDGVGRGLLVGAERVWTFLLRTPEAVEEGLRRALTDALPSTLVPAKYPLCLNGTGMTLNPDLIFGKLAVADVKYKLSKRSWRKDDLYQLVAFAAGFKVANAAMIDFAHVSRPVLETAEFGSVHVAHLTWPALTDRVPSAALEQLAREVVAWSARWEESPAPTAP